MGRSADRREERALWLCPVDGLGINPILRWINGGIIWTGKVSNCILEFPQTPMDARFLTLIDNFGSPPDNRYHLVFNKKRQGRC
jgi:hypothetical protein